ncbi:MAG: amidohydrolase [Planctomycetota bacterium]|jgi:aminobenzoyl-glutamate utilization protein B
MRTKAGTIYLSIAALLLSISSSLAGQAVEKEPVDEFIGVFISNIPIEKVTTDEWIENNRATLAKVKQRIWELSELSFEEYESSKILSDLLDEHGFEIKSGVADMPTAFVASYGSGRPIIGILAEYDALPGVSQKAVPRKEAREDVVNGHACGHCLFGTASSAAAIAARYSMERHGLKGTIRLYGCPAEELGAGKIYMSNAGLFNDCDISFHWHSDDKTKVWAGSSKAVITAKFNFHGLSAHAAASPHEGKSALDAVELMNIGANFLREHLTEDARIHYVITDGGDAPNIVPPDAQVWYFVRADKHSDAVIIFERMLDMARGAALMTGTTVDWDIGSDCPELLSNPVLSELIQKNLELVGGPKFTEAEKRFAAETQKALKGPFEYSLCEVIEPLVEKPAGLKGSTDVAAVSWIVPTSGLRTACFTYGAPLHSWQVTACGGMSIGEKGMITAARTLAYSTVEALTRPEWIEKAKASFEKQKEGSDFVSLLPKDQKAPKKNKP